MYPRLAHVILADRQDITRAGLMYLLAGMEAPTSIPASSAGGSSSGGSSAGARVSVATDRADLIARLRAEPAGVVIIDYTLFDFNDAAEMLILAQRFPRSRWLLFSEELSVGFIRLVVASSTQFGIVMKESPLSEIREALHYALDGRRFVCQQATELLLAPEPAAPEHVKLTKTETEILKDIALGKTTREIAEARFSSFHTVNTHRKNIFRKLGVNNAHEATKYALRAGLVDAAEYYI